MLTRRHLLAGAAALAAGVPFAKAQSNFASQPIHILVGYAAGGGVDIVARLLQEPMKAALGQPIIIENRTGASAMLATGAVAKAPPDGYTLLMAASGEVAINHFLFKEKMAYDPVKELAPIAMIGSVPCVRCRRRHDTRAQSERAGCLRQGQSGPLWRKLRCWRGKPYLTGAFAQHHWPRCPYHWPKISRSLARTVAAKDNHDF
jgi:hypothetical protein